LTRPRLAQTTLISASISSARYKSTWYNPTTWYSASEPVDPIDAVKATEPQITTSTLPPPDIPTEEVFQPLPSDLGDTNAFYEHLTSLAPTHTEPYIGFLHDAGLSFGWGPTSVCQWLLEHVHVYTGTPWWASILIAAVTIRVVTIPFTIRASDQTARLQAIAPVLRDLQKDKPPPSADMATQQKFAMQQWAQMSKVKEAAGVGFGGTLLNAGVQGILGFGMFRLMSGLAQTPGIGLTSEGLWWFKDLTVADPYYVLPAVMGASMFGMFYVS